MREILFRGKRFMDGEFVDGSLFIDEKKDKHEILVGYVNYRVGWEVDPETVGQYTGLTDKNGTKIFEGDIVRYNTFDDFDCFSAVKFGEYKQDGSGGEYNPKNVVGWYVDVGNFTCPDWAENDPTYFSCYLCQQNLNEVAGSCEVIGNIHDNPELLEGGVVGG